MGPVTVRQRVLFRFGLVLAMLARSGWYPAIAEATQQTLDALSARWTDVPEMPVCLAFRTPHACSPSKGLCGSPATTLADSRDPPRLSRTFNF